MTTETTAASPSLEGATRRSRPGVSTSSLAWTLVFAAIAAVYVATRLVSWQLNTQLEDHDSVGYLGWIAAFATFEWQRIEAIGPEVTPFYPFFVALFTLPGWSIETAARLCSLAFSGLLLLSLIGIARSVGSVAAGAVGLLLVALNPELIRLSHSVLTEPSFIAVIYLGLWLLLEQRDRPSLFSAALLGVILGLAFLNRLEGLIFAILFPLLQWGYSLIVHRGRAPLKKLVLWSGVCYLFFVALAAPQVWYISDRLGQFAINGRQLPASLLYKRPDGLSYEEKFYGLDYSPSQINWSYLLDNPKDLAELASSPPDPGEYVRALVANLGELNYNRLGNLVGAAALIFVAVSVVLQLQKRRYSTLFLLLGFVSIGLAGPLLHNVVIRHIAVIAPLLLLVAGDGVVRTARGAARSLGAARLAVPLGVGLTACIVGLSIKSFYQLYALPDSVNIEYTVRDLQPVVSQIEDIATEELQHPPRVVSRKTYVAYFLGDAVQFPLPYTDVEGLEQYMRLNAADFLVLHDDEIVTQRPFFQEFADGDPPPGFTLVYRSPDSPYELYRYKATAGPDT